MSKYIIALDVGFKDETIAILCELRNDKIHVIKEKRSNGTGENKITEEQMKKKYTSFIITIKKIKYWGNILSHMFLKY